MRATMSQRQLPDAAEPFTRVLACGSAREVLLLLAQAAPAIGGCEGAIRLLRPTGDAADADALERLLGAFRRRGIHVSQDRAETIDAATIIAAVRRDGHDLVLKAVPPVPSVGKRATTAIDRGLVDGCPCPVWLGDTRAANPPRRIAAAVDPGHGDRLALELSREVLGTADRMAQLTGGELHVVHAWVPFGAHFLRNRAPASVHAAYVEDARRAAHHDIDDLLSSVSPGAALSRDRVHVVPGEMYMQLPWIVTARRLDLVVVGTRGRQSRLASALVRPHARQLLERAACSTLVVRTP